MPSAELDGVRAVYFDLDDTLCCYWDACKQALRETFDAYPVEGYTTPELIGHWAQAFQRFGKDLKNTDWYTGYLIEGEPTRTEQMRLTLQSLGVDSVDLARELSHKYMTARDAALRLFPDAIDVLEQLSAVYPLGLITNGPADIQRQEVNTLGIAHFFRNIFIEGEMGYGKPLCDVFHNAAQAVDCDPYEVVMVGNSYSHDILGAHQAGWKTVWIRRASDVPPSATHNAQPEERPANGPEPTRVISELSELIPLLL